MVRINAARLVLGLALLLLLPASAQAAKSEKVPVQVRAVTWQGKILLDRKIRTGTANVPTSSKATCLGGSPSNGSKKIPGATALGALHQASKTTRKPRRLLVSDAFDFGLGLCGVGSSVAEGEEWWELTHNNRPSSLGGEGTVLERDDTVLWYLSKSFNEPSPDELSLVAPRKVKKNKKARVRVLAFDDSGKSRPVEGARLSKGGDARSNSRGYLRLKIRKKTRLVARASGLIPSNRVVIKVRR